LLFATARGASNGSFLRSAPFIEVTAKEAGPTGQLPMTLVAIDLSLAAWFLPAFK